MANNQPKLKQIQGGLLLRQQVDNLLPVLTSYQASKVTTTLVKSENDGNPVYYNAQEVLSLLLSLSNEQAESITGLSDSLTTLKTMPISDYVRLYGNVTVTEDVENQTYSTSSIMEKTEDEIEALLPQIRSTKVYAYTDDNQPIVNENGENLEFNIVNWTFNGTPYVADYSGEELTYIPLTGTTRFKVFPVGDFTLASLPQEFLLDNEELNLVYYAHAIDELAYSITKNSNLIEEIKKLVGETAISEALADLSEELTAKIDANTESIKILNSDETVEGSIAYSIKQAVDIIGLTIDDLDGRIQSVQTDVTTLKGDETTEGSIAKSIKDAVDPLTSRVTVVENAINKLNGNETVEGSVAYSIKEALDPVKTELTSVKSTAETAKVATDTLNGSVDTVGSVDYKISQVTTEKFAELDANDTKLSGKISAIIGTDTETTESITTLDSRLDAIEAKTDDWSGNTVYTNSNPIIEAHGGIQVGETFDNVPISELLTKILYPYVAPTCSISIIPSTTVYELGTTIDSLAVNIAVGKKTNEITSVEVYQDSELIETITENIVNGGTFTVNVTNISSNTKFKAVVSDGTNNVTSNEVSINFYRPVYIGSTSLDVADFTSDMVVSGTKKLQSSSTITNTYTIVSKRMFFAVPSGWSVSKILDTNGFDITNSFKTATVQVVCLDSVDGSTEPYTVYYSEPTTQTNFKVTFQN